MVEHYLAGGTAERLATVARQAREAAEGLTREGTPVRYRRSLFLVEDETCMSLYEARSQAAASRAGERAGLMINRISEAIEEVPEEGH